MAEQRSARWRPRASLATLRQAAQLRRSIRQWMDQQNVLEVCTPCLSRAAVTDVNIESLIAIDPLRTAHPWYLHTSPEFAMKRLLAAHAQLAGSCANGGDQPDIYQMCPVYRAGESGRYHNTQFMMLEWYRLRMDHHDLMLDLEDLLKHICETFQIEWPGMEKRAYGIEVRNRLGVWPEDASTAQIQQFFNEKNRSYPSSIGKDLDAALDLFVDEFVLPDFSAAAFTLLTDYPVTQASLAKIGQDDHGRLIAQRFEVFRGRVELGNGFHELQDAHEQLERFESDLSLRAEKQLAKVPMDKYFLDALVAGLPECAGIAIGLERLLMVLGPHTCISDVVSFDDERA